MPDFREVSDAEISEVVTFDFVWEAILEVIFYVSVVKFLNLESCLILEPYNLKKLLCFSDCTNSF